MPNIALSDAGLRSIEPPEKGSADYWDTKFKGFGVRVSQGGTKTFVLNIHKARRSLGRYGIVSLAEARAEAKRIPGEGPQPVLGIDGRIVAYGDAPKYILMQFTGLRDKNGREIYEGDVIHFVTSTTGRNYEVVFDNEWRGRHPQNSLCLWTDTHRIKVIGNRFQHPHLLK